MAKPTIYPKWASNETNITPAPPAKQEEGWIYQEAPASGLFNWLHNLTYKWVKWLDEYTEQINTQVEQNTDDIANLSTDNIINSSTITGSTTTDALNNIATELDEQTSKINGLINPIGSLLLYAGTPSTLPGEWLPCDGALYDKTTYKSLYDVIKETYNTGTEGSNEFRVPNLQGRVPIGTGTYLEDVDGDGTNETYSYDLGDLGGEAKHKLTTDELASHNHKVGDRTDSPNQGTTHYMGSAISGSDVYTENTGSDLPHENRQPYIGIGYYIRAR